MTLLRVSLALVCLATSNLFGQTIQISDDSANDSPVTVKGTITFNPNNRDNITCSITGHSNASQPIVAYTMVFHIVTPDGEAREIHMPRDSFFVDPAVLAMRAPQPRADFPLVTACPPASGRYGMKLTPKPPEAHIKVTFAQFDDGSVWGDDDKAVAEAMFERTETLKYLQSLRDAYSSGGDYALYQALQAEVRWDETDHRHRFMLWGTRHRLLKLNNVKAAADAIDKDLATAEEHSAWLR